MDEQPTGTAEEAKLDEALSDMIAKADAAVESGEPLVFRTDTGELEAAFSVTGDALVMTVARVTGDERALFGLLAILALRCARARGLSDIETHLVVPRRSRLKPSLRRAVERRGFTVREVPGRGACYVQVMQLPRKTG